ncbi:MAG: DUF4249 domain-containing protein [Sphingobacteriaceae bacterium]|nr:DUF4249 domain-containing protein [Sphingobacteriaceae bacterium]
MLAVIAEPGAVAKNLFIGLDSNWNMGGLKYTRALKTLSTFVCYICFLVTVISCRTPFEPLIDSPPSGYLVVEGIINTAKSSTVITLSRARLMSDPSKRPESKAEVKIIGENSATYPLVEKANGVYESDVMTLPSQRYCVDIKTGDGKRYRSSLVTPKRTPPIDSVSWQREEDGINIYVHSHDEQNQTRYYKWNTVETWEIRSDSKSEYYAVNTGKYDAEGKIIYSFPERSQEESDAMYFCWQQSISNQLLLGSTAKLSKDVISYPMVFIPNGNIKLGILYSILIEQVGLDAQQYEFYKSIKNNTETNGSIFDRQPSEMKSNIMCLTNLEEQVIGYVACTNVESKRIFINRPPAWPYRMICDVAPFPILPVLVSKDPPLGTSYACGDCRTRGSSEKPVYWP